MDKCRPPLSPQRRPGMHFICLVPVSLKKSLVSRRFSRSPPRRRPSSPAPYRSRPRSRSHTPPSKRFRPGNYSRMASPRSRSPHRRRHSRDRSRSRSQIHLENEAHNPKIKSRAASPDAIKVEPSDSFPVLETSMIEDHKQLSRIHMAEIDVKAPLNPPDTLILNQSFTLSPSQDDIKPDIRTASPVPQTLEALPANDRGIIEKIESTSHKPSPQSPMPVQAQRSPSPPRPSRNVHEITARVPPTGPQRTWPSRSPPRGPRSHPRQPIPPSSVPSYGSVPRGPRRGFPPTGPSSSFSSPPSIGSRHNNPESKKIMKPLDPDLEVRSSQHFLLSSWSLRSIVQIYRAQANRSHLAFDYLQRVKSLRRALHELDLATIDLRAAEIRRRIADAQLEKAKNGALGIDAPSVAII